MFITSREQIDETRRMKSRCLKPTVSQSNFLFCGRHHALETETWGDGGSSHTHTVKIFDFEDQENKDTNT